MQIKSIISSIAFLFFVIIANAQKINSQFKYYIHKTSEKITIDGLRINFNDGWGLLRASNTTPKLVLRFEAQTAERLSEIQELFFTQLQSIDESIQIELS